MIITGKTESELRARYTYCGKPPEIPGPVDSTDRWDRYLEDSKAYSRKRYNAANRFVSDVAETLDISKEYAKVLVDSMYDPDYGYGIALVTMAEVVSVSKAEAVPAQQLVNKVEIQDARQIISSLMATLDYEGANARISGGTQTAIRQYAKNYLL